MIQFHLKQVQLKCTQSGRTINGLMSIILHLSRQSPVPKALGASLVEEAEIRQWLEFALILFNLSNNGLVRRTMFKVLNEALSSRTFLVGNRITVADVMMYQTLHSYLMDMSYGEKEQLMHLGRWFNFIQGDKMVRQDNKLILIGRPL
ncbi:eukaryotic translation elongation factor 1 epsilon-1 isoform X2 [Hetaerina americana]|uniref:eukaryotic translation elongation factor 1 epsilon-1 isoform X2 n=1 Tax=Hetaerina americana TaxID=62018 RepID=UPI003A7F1AFF